MRRRRPYDEPNGEPSAMERRVLRMICAGVGRVPDIARRLKSGQTPVHNAIKKLRSQRLIRPARAIGIHRWTFTPTDLGEACNAKSAAAIQ